MVLMLCGYHAVAAAPTTSSASTSSTASHIVRSTNPSTYVGSSTSSTQSGRVATQYRPPAGRKSGTKRANRSRLRSSPRLNLRA
ncbi:hypothetical protein EDB92DRAFT_1874967 [Lactarius akahatsu]|uniref:Uncharacterized protein n=1 Tax=Lactarius akahatsu TaxID=416441 RepID=A0AAD4LHP5_9AGAM|nr:hypothetical protein EDB92DRAFT_1874967 [Lactarius akahatsu]